eukprot:362479-Amphidinium_carterae.1
MFGLQFSSHTRVWVDCFRHHGLAKKAHARESITFLWRAIDVTSYDLQGLGIVAQRHFELVAPLSSEIPRHTRTSACDLPFPPCDSVFFLGWQRFF